MQAEWAAWLRLQRTSGVGPETARRLLQAFGLPEAIFEAGHAALSRVVSGRVAEALLASPDPAFLALCERTARWLESPDAHVLTLADAAYPRTLLDISDPPILLYAKGNPTLLDTPALAVVGSRHGTQQGQHDAEAFAHVLSDSGVCIVSGLAAGIDSAAHRGGLRGRARSVAVIGTGADIVYPARNRALAHQLAEEGCLLSEYPLGTPAIASNFPRRNRLISGLGRGVFVVEAAPQSGSLITARMAAEQGRDVFALPGSIHSPLSRGCHQLIREGAKLVETAQDILDELRLPARLPLPLSAPQADTAGEAPGSPLLSALGAAPVDLDTLAQRTGLAVAVLSSDLLLLEMNGQVEALPGGMYRRLFATNE